MLSAGQLDQFVEHGFVPLRSALPRSLAAACRRLAADQLHVDLDDPTSWREPVVRGHITGPPVQEAADAPVLVEAVHQLLDPDDWLPRSDLGLFVVRFPGEADPGDAGWHIDSSFEAADGRWFVNYRSRRRGLLLLCLLSDVEEDDAPTRIVPGSHRKMASLLRHFGDDGVFGLHAPLPEVAGPIALATGEAGDIYVCHPFLVHAASWPHRGTAPRFVAQPPVALVDALRIQADIDDLSPVARVVHSAINCR